MKREVAITGLGAVTALGEGAGALWQAALEGRSGIDFVSEGLIGAVVRDFDPEKFVPQKKSLKVMARDIQLAVAASSLAMDDAGAKSLSVVRDRFGVIVGSGVLNHELDELGMSVRASLDENGKLDMKRFGEEGIRALFPLWLLKYLPNMPACHISISFDLEGPNNTLTTGPSAGLQAVGEACRIIERGAADVMLAGGAESKVNPVGYSLYRALGVLLSVNGLDPKKSCRPFDALAKGVVIGEGAGFLVLEELEHAKKRGAKIYAKVLGVGSSSAEGRALAMQAALADAGLHAGDLRYMQASGLGLEEEDAREAEAIERVFGSAQSGLWVTSSKPVMGFTGFSAGALDLILSTLSLKNRAIPPLMNFEKPARPYAFHIAKSSAPVQDMRYAMTNAFGLNGQSISVITEVWKDN